MFCIQREFDADGDPVGYVRGKLPVTPPDHHDLYDKLGNIFRFKDARLAYGKGDQATNGWLTRLIVSGWVIKFEASRCYRKTDPRAGTE
jgi:hypothetical protein